MLGFAKSSALGGGIRQRIKERYATASILSADQVVFNIKGNGYRLVAAIDYGRQILFIKWIGTLTNYDRIDARKVQYGD
jgi:mRNA interferase HigB